MLYVQGNSTSVATISYFGAFGGLATCKEISKFNNWFSIAIAMVCRELNIPCWYPKTLSNARIYLTSQGITVLVAFLNTKVRLHILDGVSLTLCFRQLTRNYVRIHHLGGVFIVPKRIKTCIQMILAVNQVKVDIPTV